MSAEPKTTWPLYTSVIVLAVVCIILLRLSLSLTEGNPAYTLDDTYIHLAMARNLVQSGTWGINAGQFAPCSSSPIWTLTMALSFVLFGVNETTPLVLNLVFAFLSCAAVFYILRRHDIPAGLNFLFLTAVVFLSPLPAVIFCGMEHTMHIFFALIFAYMASLSIAGKSHSTGSRVLLTLAAFMMSGLRYESLFILSTAFLLMMLRKQFATGFIVLAAGLLPVVVHGIVSVSHGWWFLPSTVVIKGNTAIRFSPGGIAGFISGAASRLIDNPHFLILLLSVLLLLHFSLEKKADVWRTGPVFAIIFAASGLMHITFAQMGWFYRYEAYLMVLGFTAIALLYSDIAIGGTNPLRLSKYLSRRPVLVLVILIALLPMLKHAAKSLYHTPRAAGNIYEQQYMTGLYLREYHSGKNVAALDVGAINYLANINCLDLVGLANKKVAPLRRNGLIDTDALRELGKNFDIDIAVLFNNRYNTDKVVALPHEWLNAGQWKIPRNIVCASDTVNFYAIDSSEFNYLIETLREFSGRLPSGVIRRGRFTE